MRAVRSIGDASIAMTRLTADRAISQEQWDARTAARKMRSSPNRVASTDDLSCCGEANDNETEGQLLVRIQPFRSLLAGTEGVFKIVGICIVISR